MLSELIHFFFQRICKCLYYLINTSHYLLSNSVEIDPGHNIFKKYKYKFFVEILPNHFLPNTCSTVIYKIVTLFSKNHMYQEKNMNQKKRHKRHLILGEFTYKKSSFYFMYFTFL